jgi:hypothetical protein
MVVILDMFGHAQEHFFQRRDADAIALDMKLF